jgi:hypothetical protein
MAIKKKDDTDRWNPEPRWLAWVVVLVVGGLNAALPANLIVGPRWGFTGIVVIMLIPTIISHAQEYHVLDRMLGYAVSALITAGMIASVSLLIEGLPNHRESPTELLVAASSLWATNILVFALWYWRLDAGGPHGRDKRQGHMDGAFLFPQMTLPPEVKTATGAHKWSPNFLDYLFLAFNTSTAFSPTDVPVLTRWAKVMMMLQSLISLTVLVLLAARAVNIL